MTAKKWRNKIKQLQEKAGIYHPSFDATIEKAATTLEEQDNVFQKFIDEGRKYTIIKTSDRGAENVTVNPIFKLWQELNRQSLEYWRELGLTAKSLKAITGDATQSATVSMADLLKSVEM